MKIPLLYLILSVSVFLTTASAKLKLVVGSYYQQTMEHAASFDSSVTLQSEYGTVGVVNLSNDMTIVLQKQGILVFDKKALEHSNAEYYLTTKLIEGEAYFNLAEAPNEQSVFFVNTPSAELEIHSSEFFVEAGEHTTYVRCFSGHIIVTNPSTMKITQIAAGDEATVTGSDNDKNLLVQSYKLTELQIESWHKIRKIVKSSFVEWVLVDGKYLVKKF